MDDLISRQAAIDELDKGAWGVEWDKALATAMLKDLPSAQPEQRWLPCSEKLPEKSGRYLVTRKFNALFRLWDKVYIVNYSDLMELKKEKIWWSGNVGKSDFEKFDDVIAWMPLPEPYREEGTEE